MNTKNFYRNNMRIFRRLFKVSGNINSTLDKKVLPNIINVNAQVNGLDKKFVNKFL